MSDSSLTVRVEEIRDDGFDLDCPVSVEWLSESLGEESPFTPTGEGQLILHLHRVSGTETNQIIHVRGRAKLELGAECSRCLGQVSLAIDVPIEVALFPAGHEPPAKSDGEVQSSDMGVANYSGHEINLSDLVHDEVFLQLPMNPICSDTCAGLCSICGTNRNESSCDCEPQTEQKWNVFSEIKKD